jgi:predicted nucleic acid-binding protein
LSSSVYLDSSVFLDVFEGRDEDGQIRALFKELKKKKAKVHTSIITIEEVSVSNFRKGRMTNQNYEKVHKFARIEGIDRDVALTTAKFEAALLDSTAKLSDQEKAAENKRRRWDLFHIATAVSLGCSTFYCSDKGYQQRKERLGIRALQFLEPRPENLPLDLRDVVEEPKADSKEAGK